MSSELKLYVIRNGEGMFSNGGSPCRWRKVPKVWTSFGHAKSSLIANCKRWVTGSGYQYIDPPKDWAIVEIPVVFDTAHSISCLDLVEKAARSANLKKKYGSAFADLVDVIEAKDEESVYQWVLVVGSYREKEATREFKSIIKSNKLKQNVDYRVVQRGFEAAFAFKDKTTAMMLKLAYGGESVGIDIQQYVEIDIDAKP